MKLKGTPFAKIDDRWFIISNFSLGSEYGFAPIREIFEDLLEKYPASEILVLRRLCPEEANILKNSTRDAEHEAWARIVALAGDNRGVTMKKPDGEEVD